MDLSRVRVVVLVTLLSIASGALAGLAIAFVLDVLSGGPSLDGPLYAFGLLAGASLGAALGPAAAFGFLRRIPLGRLFGQTIAGAVLGGLAGFGFGFVFPRYGDGITSILGGGVLGFLVASAALWRQFRTAPSALQPPAD